MKNNIKERIKNVMSAVFTISKNQIKDDASPDSIDSWDSLKHMNLVVALEEEFKIQFSDDEITDTTNYTSFVSILEEKINQ